MYLRYRHKFADVGDARNVWATGWRCFCAVVPVLLTILGLTSDLNAEAADGVVIFSGDDVVVARRWELDSASNVKAVTDAGKTVTIARKDVLALSAGSAMLRSAQFPRVVLENGEVIAAELAERQEDGHVVFASVMWGELRVPFGRIIRHDAVVAIMAENPPPAPFVLLKNGDALAAELKQIGSEDLTVGTEFGDTPIARMAVAAIVLSDESPPTDGRDGNGFLVELADGQRVYCDQVVAGGADAVTLVRGRASCLVKRGDVQRIAWPGTIIGYASAMKFSATGVGYFGQDVVTERDRNATGRPLRLGQRWFARGFGTRSKSQVSLTLDGQWSYLHGWVGLDSRLGRSGDCTVAVTVEDHEVIRAELHSAGHIERLIVPLGDAGRIAFDCDFGPSGDLGDYVNWCDLLLVGVKQEANK